MKERRKDDKRWAICLVVFSAIICTFTCIDVNAAKSVTILINREEQMEYTTLPIGSMQSLEVTIEGEELIEVQWKSNNPDVAAVYGDQNKTILEAKTVGSALISSVIITDTGSFTREFWVYTRTDPEQMVYLEDELKQITDEEYALRPRATGDVTMYINGEVRRNYNTVGIGDTRAATIEVEGEIVQKIEWSSNDTSVVTISGDKDGATFKAVSEGIATITADITTDLGRKSKDLIISTRTDVILSILVSMSFTRKYFPYKPTGVQRPHADRGGGAGSPPVRFLCCRLSGLIK